jgi:hypothetical protein
VRSASDAHALVFEQPGLAMQATGITGRYAALPDDAVTRNRDQQGIRSTATPTARTARGHPRR